MARILGDNHSLSVTRLIGAGQVLIAVWLLTGIRWKWSCAFRILQVATMNAIEFLLAAALLPQPEHVGWPLGIHRRRRGSDAEASPGRIPLGSGA